MVKAIGHPLEPPLPKAHHTSIPQSLLISFNKNKSTAKLSIRLLRFALRLRPFTPSRYPSEKPP
uniref:Uncharacterized protein n=1 Tax=Enterococcus phage PMBT56 TaxID=3229530 RepID=A0AB39C6B3_9CAUD